MNRRYLRNRVTATGEIIAHPSRGLFMGNRGILHGEDRKIGRALWKHKAWIICRLVWKDWKRVPMTPGAYTELFFLDEAVALAAGHRPCAMCRRSAYRSYAEAAEHKGSAPELDTMLHQERAIPRRFEQRRHRSEISDLPDGAVALLDGAPVLISGDTVIDVSLFAYGPRRERPKRGVVTVLTPATSLKALRNGYVPVFHDSLKG